MENKNAVNSLSVTGDGIKIITSSNENGTIKVWGTLGPHQFVLIKEWVRPASFPEIAVSPHNSLVVDGKKTMDIYTMEGTKADHYMEIGRCMMLQSFSRW